MNSLIDPNNWLSPEEKNYLLGSAQPDAIKIGQINKHLEDWRMADPDGMCEIEYWWLSTRIYQVLHSE